VDGLSVNDRADLRERLRRAADWVPPPPPWSQWTSDISADRLLIDPGDAESGDRRARRIAWVHQFGRVQERITGN
jgi:hypothetical protein